MGDVEALFMHSSIPRVMCPRCASAMRLAQVISEENGQQMKFDCSCGFEYQMSTRVRDEQGPRAAAI